MTEKMLALLAVTTLPACSTVNGVYEAMFPGANFSPDKYEETDFSLATSPSAADRNRHRKMKFTAFYFGVANNVGKNEIVAQHINITLCEDASRRDCSSRIVVHDMDSDSVLKIPKGSPVTFYGMVGEVQSLDYGNISVANTDGSLNDLFFLKAHRVVPK